VPNKHKKKVLFLITKSSWGGAQRYVFDLATNINPEEYDPVVAVGGKDELYDTLRQAGLRVISIKDLGRDVSLLKDLMASVRIAHLLIKERPHVLHVNSSKVGVFGTLLGRLLFLPRVIFTSHGWAFNEERPVWQKRVIKFLQWLTVFFSHTTIVVSSGLKKDMDWPFIQKKMVVVHLGRNASTLKNKRDARELLAMKIKNTSTSLYEHIDDLWLGTIAELHPTKRLDVAIDAVASLVAEFPNLRYVIIHDGQERERLQAQVEKQGLLDHVFFTGTIPEAAQLLPALDVFVLPSRSEAFGYVLIEAGNANIPVIASNVGGIPDIITDKKNGLLVPPENVSQLANAMRELIENHELRAKLAEAHHNRTGEFTLEKMVERTEWVYESH